MRVEHTPHDVQAYSETEIMAEEKPEHAANECYEALLDLKSIFPAWSDAQDNFHYHWREILSSTTKGNEQERETLEFYKETLREMVESKGDGIAAQNAVELIMRLDSRRKERDETFEQYNVENMLGKDTSAIRPKPPVKRQTVQRRPAAEVTADVVPEGGHVYGTRTKSRRLQARDAENGQGGKLEYSSSGFGTHLRKGFFSDYVWDFLVPTGEENEYDNEIDQGVVAAADDDDDDEGRAKKTKRSRK
ncbi:transcription factor with AP2 domain-containing protein, putative [Babesia ovata]|uniref:Transcription factor with AP2 domain-containing protein, putative n=1 Tax=Babesia ovata TaxID=189622 RepID=A0A2H6KEY6_9APIC|nr:transcription factor with AP2 domain-containing protein, putative [Babesia ovata]GBE61546.1 transcription factor with AP2 domain-containing protein, putative [Babesia ovata]